MGVRGRAPCNWPRATAASGPTPTAVDLTVMVRRCVSPRPLAPAPSLGLDAASATQIRPAATRPQGRGGRLSAARPLPRSQGSLAAAAAQAENAARGSGRLSLTLQTPTERTDSKQTGRVQDGSLFVGKDVPAEDNDSRMPFFAVGVV